MNISKESAVGVVFLISIVILAAVAMTTRTDYAGANYAIQVRFANVGGLNVGDEVRLSGRAIGYVENLEVLTSGKQKGILVTLKVDRAVALHPDYQIIILDRSTIGGKAIDIDVGDVNLPALPNRAPYLGVTRTDALSKFAGLVDTTMPKANRLLDQLNTMISDMRNSEGLIGRVVYDTEFSKKIERLVTNFDTLATTLADPENGFLAEFHATFESARKGLDNVQKLTEDLRSGEGSLSLLLQERQAYDRFVDVLSELQKTSRQLNQVAHRIKKDPQLLLLGERTEDAGFWRGTVLGRGPLEEEEQPFEPTDLRARGPK